MTDIDLRLGRWQDVLADVECDALICDPPYGKRTHEGQRHGRKDSRYCDTADHPNLAARGLGYSAWGEDEVNEFVGFWAPRTRGWFCAFTSHDLVRYYMSALELSGRYVYAPIACVQNAMNVRLAGDGPSNWTTWLVVARPKWKQKWGALPGAYVGPSNDAGLNSLDRSKRVVAGGKPVWLMREIVRDYSRPGDLIVDPCAGGGTTLRAARVERRRCIGAEVDPETYAGALTRLHHGFGASPKQEGMAF
jgi:site-specific DNA-methyltransferase (adenine-specific)